MQPFAVDDRVRRQRLELDAVPDRAGALAGLGFDRDEQLVVYAPRGMPFGRDFGRKVLACVAELPLQPR